MLSWYIHESSWEIIPSEMVSIIDKLHCYVDFQKVTIQNKKHVNNSYFLKMYYYFLKTYC